MRGQHDGRERGGKADRMRRRMAGAIAAALIGMAGCSAPVEPRPVLPLQPGETPELRGLINEYADRYQVPESLCTRSSSAKATIGRPPATAPITG
jgi:hypothetical protein